jgi:hypothetical protein
VQTTRRRRWGSGSARERAHLRGPSAAYHLKAQGTRRGGELPIVRGEHELLVLDANQQRRGQMDGTQRANERWEWIRRALEHRRSHSSRVETAQHGDDAFAAHSDLFIGELKMDARSIDGP